MFVAFVLCTAWTALCGSVLIAGTNPVIGDQNEAILESIGVFGSKPFETDFSSTYGLTKDVLDTVSPAALALTKLLSKSKGVAPYTMTSKNYMKHGDFGTAMQDFEKFGPTHIKHTKTKTGVHVIEGRTEGFKLKIYNSRYKPHTEAVLEITEYATKKGDPTRTYIITYKHMKNDRIY